MPELLPTSYIPRQNTPADTVILAGPTSPEEFFEGILTRKRWDIQKAWWEVRILYDLNFREIPEEDLKKMFDTYVEKRRALQEDDEPAEEVVAIAEGSETENETVPLVAGNVEVEVDIEETIQKVIPYTVPDMSNPVASIPEEGVDKTTGEILSKRGYTKNTTYQQEEEDLIEIVYTYFFYHPDKEYSSTEIFKHFEDLLRYRLRPVHNRRYQRWLELLYTRGILTRRTDYQRCGKEYVIKRYFYKWHRKNL